MDIPSNRQIWIRKSNLGAFSFGELNNDIVDGPHTVIIYFLSLYQINSTSVSDALACQQDTLCLS